MITAKLALALVMSFLTITGFGYWRYQVGAQNHPVAQLAFIQDPSDSVEPDCNRTVAMVQKALALPEVGSGSTISLFALGDVSTANEPKWLGQFEVPVIRRVIEGQIQNARATQSLLAKVRGRCEEVKQTQKSPIFEGIKRGAEHLQTIGSPNDARYLFIQTDGEELENNAIRKALNEIPGAPFSFAAPIRNPGIQIKFCGLAETIGSVTDAKMRVHHLSRQRDNRRADRLKEVWQHVFTNPELVSFEPYCSR